EIRERRVAARFLDRLEARDQRSVARLFSVEMDALVIAKEMRRGVEADFVAGFEEDALEDGAGGAFAVGSADGDNNGRLGPCPRLGDCRGRLRRGDIHARKHVANAIEPERDRRGMLRGDVGEPVVERAAQASGTGSRFSSVMNWAT